MHACRCHLSFDVFGHKIWSSRFVTLWRQSRNSILTHRTEPIIGSLALMTEGMAKQHQHRPNRQQHTDTMLQTSIRVIPPYRSRPHNYLNRVSARDLITGTAPVPTAPTRRNGWYTESCTSSSGGESSHRLPRSAWVISGSLMLFGVFHVGLRVALFLYEGPQSRRDGMQHRMQSTQLMWKRSQSSPCTPLSDCHLALLDRALCALTCLRHDASSRHHPPRDESVRAPSPLPQPLSLGAPGGVLPVDAVVAEEAAWAVRAAVPGACGRAQQYAGLSGSAAEVR